MTEITRDTLPRKPRRDAEVEVTICELAPQKAAGIARWPVTIGPDERPRDLVVKVPHTLPGERVRARVQRSRRNALEAALVDVLEPSPERVEPRCRHAGPLEMVDDLPGSRGCGGCALQHMTYAAQLASKRELVERLLCERNNGPRLEIEVRPTIGCADPWYYRNKMEISFAIDVEGEVALGMHPRGFRYDVIDMHECHLASPILAPLVRANVAWARSHGLQPVMPHSDRPWLYSVTLREGKNTGERMVNLTTTHVDEVITGDGTPVSASTLAGSWAAMVRETFETLGAELTTMVWHRRRRVKGERTSVASELLHGPGTLTEMLRLPGGRELRFDVAPDAFFQPNTRQAEVLYTEVLRAALDHPDALPAATDAPPLGHALDLYCGTGTIGLCLAPFASRVTGVEMNADAVANAKENAVRNGLDATTHWIAGDVGDVLGDELAGVRADVVVVDPPRGGLLGASIDHLTTIAAARLVYVSCNPEALARDLVRLDEVGYAVTRIQPVDMFPHTGHIETVVSLRHTPM